MSWVTIVWSMIAASCLTLGMIYSLVWYRSRASWAHLLFSLSAISTAAFAFFELWMMRAETPAEFLLALKWVQVPIFTWLVSVVWFVHIYLGAGRRWLAWTITGLRTVYLLIGLFLVENVIFRDMPSVGRFQLLGESVTVAHGLPSPWLVFGQTSAFAALIFFADATITAWRRGDRQKGVMVGGSAAFFLLMAFVTTSPVVWGVAAVPLVLSLPYMAMIAVMAYEVSRDVLRASLLVQQLQASEAALRDLSGRLISAQEEERHRIARELHDNVSQQLAMLTIRIDQVAATVTTSPGALARSMSDLRHRAMEISNEIHGLSHRLHSSKLEMLGLAEALRAHCQELLARGVHARLHDQGLPPSLPKDIELCLFRIVQEALNNVVKHSGAREADVTIRLEGRVLVMTVGDRGCGFDAAGASVRSGLGLASMRERLRPLNGEVTVHSHLGQGTTISVHLPIPRAGSATADVAVVA